jgi:hypothetical protein
MGSIIDLPPDIRAIGQALVAGLEAVLHEKLYGVYLYGAIVFEDGGPAQDIDCHVILASKLSDQEHKAILALHCSLAEEFPPLGGELDAYYILLDAAGKPEVPQHQLWPGIYDHAWALHCAHIRSGFFVGLYGPIPDDIFPMPVWGALEQALDHELKFVQANRQYPAYGILNLCRILYSFQTGDVAVSKRFSGRWFAETYPEWAIVVDTAIRHYDGLATEDDGKAMSRELARFLAFVETHISETRANQNIPS